MNSQIYIGYSFIIWLYGIYKSGSATEHEGESATILQ
jgi:hypothetical protein